MQPTALCEGSFLAGCGSIPADQFEQLLVNVGELQAGSRTARKDGQKGWQHTPAFMLEVVKQALDNCSSCSPNTQLVYARGGTTDVGQHTGSDHRDTCWALVRESLKVCIITWT